MEDSSVASIAAPQQGTINEKWVASFAERQDLLSGPNKLVSARNTAVEKIASTPFPTRRDEDWRYSDFTRVLNKEWTCSTASPIAFDRNTLEIPDFKGIVLVTVDGEYRPDLSDSTEGLDIHTLEEAVGSNLHDAWLTKTLKQVSNEAENTFVAINAAFAKTSLVVSGRKNAKVEKPIHVIHVGQRGDYPRMINSQVFVHMPQGAELTIDETFATVGEGEPIFRNHLIRAEVLSQARLAYRSIQTETVEDYHHSNFFADQQGGSFIDHVRVDFGGAQVRNNLTVEHRAAGLETHLSGMFFARGKQQIDNQTYIDHAFPHGESNEMYKGIVMDKAVTSFNGKVLVRPDAQKTNAYQQNDNLVIGDKAEANAKPQLEIFADDVKCSHGATIGQMDMAPVYYLMSRGINRGTALSMLQRGFLLEVLERIESEAVRAYVEDLLIKKFAS